MRYLVNFSNQVAAGPRMIAKSFILEAFDSDDDYIFVIPNIEFYSELPQRKGVEYIRVASYAGSWKSLVLIFYVNFYLVRKLCRDNKVDRLLAFGNFCFGFKGLPAVVLLHHPYIVDDTLYDNLSVFSKFVEFIKRRLFVRTIKNCRTVIVQTDNMRSLYLDKYGSINSNVVTIPNPISNIFRGVVNSNRILNKDSISFFYPSRFYPHKNHEQALNLASKAMHKKLPLKVYVTINPSIPGAKDLLVRAKGIDNFVNLGELSQEDLIPFYTNSSYMFFPSLSETYGNPLAEAMIAELPVIAPEMGYARSVVGQGGWYFDSKKTFDEISDDILNYVFSNEVKDYEQLVKDTSEAKSSLFFPNEWLKKIKSLY